MNEKLDQERVVQKLAELRRHRRDQGRATYWSGQPPDLDHVWTCATEAGRELYRDLMQAKARQSDDDEEAAYSKLHQRHVELSEEPTYLWIAGLQADALEHKAASEEAKKELALAEDQLSSLRLEITQLESKYEAERSRVVELERAQAAEIEKLKRLALADDSSSEARKEADMYISFYYRQRERYDKLRHAFFIVTFFVWPSICMLLYE